MSTPSLPAPPPPPPRPRVLHKQPAPTPTTATAPTPAAADPLPSKQPPQLVPQKQQQPQQPQEQEQLPVNHPIHPDHPIHEKIKARDSQVAELIDEIVYMERVSGEKEKSLQDKIEFQSQLIENTISYAILLEQAIIVPAVGNIDNFLSSSSSTSGSGGQLSRMTANTRQRIANNNNKSVLQNLSEDLQQLLQQFRVGPDFVMAKQRREQVMRNIVDRLKTPMANTSMDVEDALVLVECLLEQQQQLGVLLADTSKKLTGLDPESTVPTSDQQEILRRKDAELVVLQSQIKHFEQLVQTHTSKLQVADEEIARLSKSARSSGALEELQKHYQVQEEKYLTKLHAAERDQENRLQERLAEASRLENMQRMVEEGIEEKNVMRAEMDKLREVAVNATRAASQDWSSTTNNGFNAGVSTSNNNINNNGRSASTSGEHSLRMELERSIREHSTVVTQLESEIAHLRSQLVQSQQEAAGSTAQKMHLDQLHRNNELLRQEISQLQHRIASRDNNSMQREQDAEKIAAMESTIQQLSDEVSAVDARIRSMHAQHLAERERLQQQLERERTRFQQERDETDALVWRMTSELEYLVKDNALLKAKLEGLQEALDQDDVEGVNGAGGLGTALDYGDY